MAEEQGQEPNENGTPGASTTPAAGVTEQTGQEPAGQSEADNIIKSLRSENAKHRTELKDVKAQLEQFKQAQMSETEKAAARLQQLEAENAKLITAQRDNALRSAITTAAARLGVKHVDAALRLIDTSALDIADDGKVSGADAAMRDLVKQYPGLFGPGPDNAGNPDTGQRGGLTLDEIKRMTPEQYIERKAEVDAVLAKGAGSA